jgi:hypothetical protein
MQSGMPGLYASCRGRSIFINGLHSAATPSKIPVLFFVLQESGPSRRVVFAIAAQPDTISICGGGYDKMQGGGECLY